MQFKTIKTFLIMALIVAVSVVGFTSNASAAVTLVNTGFETGDTTGWTEIIPPGGSVSVPSSGATEGTYYTHIKTNGPGSYTRVLQTFTADAGDTIGGSAIFNSGDYLPFDDDGVVLIRAGGPEGPIDTYLFYASVCLVGTFGSSGWTQWTHTFDTAGTYTLEARTSNFLDGILDSNLGIDGYNSALPASPTDPSPCGGAGGPVPPEEPEDETPPVIELSVETDTLWSPNHKMVDVGYSLTVTDDMDESPTVTVTVTSDEPDNGKGDGNTINDIQWDGDNLLLRAERAGGGDGRTYTITVTATDESGNSSTASVTVSVPKSKGKK